MTTHEQHEASEIEAFEIEEPGKIKDYRPFAVQTTFLIALMGLTSCLITILMVLRHLAPITTQDPNTVDVALNYLWAIITAPAVIYACIWLAVDFDVMRMEPIYQFAESRGDQSGSIESLTFSYTTCNALTIPFRALKRKQWAVFYSSLSHLIASIVLPTVVTGMMDFENEYPTILISFRPVFFWIAIVSLAAILLSTGCLIKKLWDRRSGVKADPSSVIGMAITFAGTDVLAQLRLLKAHTPPESTNLLWLHCHRINGNANIVLLNHGSATVAQQPLLTEATCIDNMERKPHLVESVIGEDPRPLNVSHMIKSLNKAPGLVILPLLVLSVVITCFLPRGSQAWMITHNIRPVLVLISTLIKSLWTTIERGKARIALTQHQQSLIQESIEAQISEPFIRLAKHRSGSATAVLASVYGSPFGSSFVALRHGYVYPVTIAFTVLLVEINTILLPDLFTTFYGEELVGFATLPAFMLLVWC